MGFQPAEMGKGGGGGVGGWGGLKTNREDQPLVSEREGAGRLGAGWGVWRGGRITRF